MTALPSDIIIRASRLINCVDHGILRCPGYATNGSDADERRVGAGLGMAAKARIEVGHLQTGLPQIYARWPNRRRSQCDERPSAEKTPGHRVEGQCCETR